MKSFKWKKLGIVFDPEARFPWMNTHAQVPYSIDFKNHIRVYFSTRENKDSNLNFKSYSGFVDLDKKNILNVLNVSKKPILDLGGLGEFDEFGSMAGSVIRHNNKYLLYYCGWQRCSSVPYNWSIGIAESNDGISFKKMFTGPILAASKNEPFLQACPIVYKLSDDDWRMYYLSGVKWFIGQNGKPESQYLIMHAKSIDGINWKRTNEPLIQTTVEDECQTSSSIFFKDGFYHMFFSYRYGSNFREDQARSYKIGYAYSKDLKSWTRNDLLAGINPSDYGWDSQMIGYPHIFKIDEKFYMLYCGNGFGEKGFGCAIME
jgi:predicted GH43/DUF377 family glycosyl hydrolase